MMAAGSFFTPVVPNAEAHLGISFSAAHWLREQPSLAAGSWCFCDAREPERAILAELAAEDWRVFLSARAHELVSGGALIVTMIGTAEKSGVTAHELVQFLRDTAQEFVDEGRLERSVFEQFVFPTYARSVDEAQAPFLSGGALAPYFEVETADVVPVANPYLPLLQRGETAKYIDSYVGFVRAFTAATLLAHVFGPGGRQEKPDVLLEAYYDRLRERLAQNPERGVFKDWTLRIVANRR